MKKGIKLICTVSIMALSLAIFTFSVYAATTVTFSVTSTVSYSIGKNIKFDLSAEAYHARYSTAMNPNLTLLNNNTTDYNDITGKLPTNKMPTMFNEDFVSVSISDNPNETLDAGWTPFTATSGVISQQYNSLVWEFVVNNTNATHGNQLTASIDWRTTSIWEKTIASESIAFEKELTYQLSTDGLTWDTASSLPVTTSSQKPYIKIILRFTVKQYNHSLNEADLNFNLNITEPTSIPLGYTQLDYIETATNQQWIDTGINATSDIDIEVDGYLAIPSSLFGMQSYMNVTGYNSTLVAMDYGGDTSRLPQLSASVEERHIYTFRDQKSYIDNVLYRDNYPTTTFSSPNNLMLFARSYYNTNEISDRGAGTKIYYCKIWNNSTLVRNFIPCINTNSETGMFDTVTQTFFGNSGTGDFVSGNPVLPSGYQRLIYLQSTGTQYIDTGIVPCDTIGISATASFSNADIDGVLVGAKADSNNTRCYVAATGGSDTIYMGWNENNSSDTRPTYTVNTIYEMKLNYLNNRKRITNDVESTAISTTLSYPTQVTMYLFACNWGGAVEYNQYACMYACKITNNGTLVRNFIPCTLNGEAGMFDTVTRQFFGNQGTGDFITPQFSFPTDGHLYA